MRENPFKWHSIASWAAAKEPRALSSRQGTDALTHMHLRAKTPDSEITAQFLNYPLCFRFHVFFLLFLNIRLQLKKSFDDFWVLTGITSYFACFKPFSSTIFYRLISYFPISSSYPPSPSIIYTAIRPLYTVSIIHPPSPPPYFPNISSYFSFILTSYLVFFRLFYFFSIFQCLSSPLLSPSPSISASPESLIWYLSGMGPINPARLCLYSTPLIRMHTGDILLLLVVRNWSSRLSNSSF